MLLERKKNTRRSGTRSPPNKEGRGLHQDSIVEGDGSEAMSDTEEGLGGESEREREKKVSWQALREGDELEHEDSLDLDSLLNGRIGLYVDR